MIQKLESQKCKERKRKGGKRENRTGRVTGKKRRETKGRKREKSEEAEIQRQYELQKGREEREIQFQQMNVKAEDRERERMIGRS